MTSALYPSWLEIPVHDLHRARAFYEHVFDLAETSQYEEAGMKIVVLRASNKAGLQPGVSLVASPRHHPCRHGVQLNFHVGRHDTLAAVLDRLTARGGEVLAPLATTDDGVRYVTVLDCEGNSFALSSFEP